MTTQNGRDLFAPADERTDWRRTATIGGHLEDTFSMASGYLDAANTLAEVWRDAGGSRDHLVLPIAQNYRHAIELALKIGIADAAVCVRRDGDQDADLLPPAINARLSTTHSIGDLVQFLTDLLARLNLGDEQQLPEDAAEVLASLHALDATGQAFRYDTVKTGSGKNRKVVRARPDEQRIDFAGVAEALRDATNIILHGVSGVLDVYEEYQRDMADWAGGEY